MKSPLPRYAGPLTVEQIVAGIAAAQANAKRLLDDAKLLVEAGSFPSAASLAILSLEERGKVTILKRLAIVTDPADVKSVWREYRSHRAKNGGWIIRMLIAEGARTMQGMASAVDPEAEHTGVLDAVKQIGFYTDCAKKGHWSIPSEVVDEKLARSLIATAEGSWNARPVTFREVELWQQMVRPHYAKPTMTEAVVRCQRALWEEGLSTTTPESLEAFMRG